MNNNGIQEGYAISYSPLNSKKDMKNTTDLKSFHFLENGEIGFSALNTIKTSDQLDPGFYSLSWDPYPREISKLYIMEDMELHNLHSFPAKKNLDELFTSFFRPDIKDQINELGFHHKVGVLMYGEEGTGKSTILKGYCKKAINENKAIVFFIDMEMGGYLSKMWNFILQVRKIQGNPIIIVLEEMDRLLELKQEATLKIMLDGNTSIDNCIFFGTTNYIDEIPSTLKNRPSRFKYCLQIEGIQEMQEIQQLVSKMLSKSYSEKDISKISQEVKGYTLDKIKQYCINKIMDIEAHSIKKPFGFFKKTA